MKYFLVLELFETISPINCSINMKSCRKTCSKIPTYVQFYRSIKNWQLVECGKNEFIRRSSSCDVWKRLRGHPFKENDFVPLSWQFLSLPHFLRESVFHALFKTLEHSLLMEDLCGWCIRVQYTDGFTFEVGIFYLPHDVYKTILLL